MKTMEMDCECMDTINQPCAGNLSGWLRSNDDTR